MSEKQVKSGQPGEVLQFPLPSIADEPSPTSGDEELLNAVLSPIRSTKTREANIKASRRSHEELELFLRAPGVRSRIAACAATHLTELVPQALKGFDDAIHARESWAYKVLLDAIGFERLAEGALSGEREKQDLVISDAFERDLVENMLDLLRGKPANDQPQEQSSEEDSQ